MDHLEEFRIPEEAIARMQRPGFLEKALSEGKTLQEIIGFSETTMEKFYQSACVMFHEGRFKHSEDAFTFLTTLNPNTFAFWLGLAMSYHHLEEYEQALLAYSCASNADRTHPLPDFYAASCHLSLGNKEQTAHHLEDAIAKCKVSEVHSELLKRCENAYKRLKVR
jgi:type III secretion system low calcium response chaperone LcrH/SycD